MKCRTACKNQELKICLEIFIVDFIIINATTTSDFLLLIYSTLHLQILLEIQKYFICRKIFELLGP